MQLSPSGLDDTEPGGRFAGFSVDRPLSSLSSWGRFLVFPCGDDTPEPFDIPSASEFAVPTAESCCGNSWLDKNFSGSFPEGLPLIGELDFLVVGRSSPGSGFGSEVLLSWLS